MANPQRTAHRPELGVRKPAKPDKQSDKQSNKQSEETLREQAKTETEQRPYLDTEGGE